MAHGQTLFLHVGVTESRELSSSRLLGGALASAPRISVLSKKGSWVWGYFLWVQISSP